MFMFTGLQVATHHGQFVLDLLLLEPRLQAVQRPRRPQDLLLRQHIQRPRQQPRRARQDLRQAATTGKACSQS